MTITCSHGIDSTFLAVASPLITSLRGNKFFTIHIQILFDKKARRCRCCWGCHPTSWTGMTTAFRLASSHLLCNRVHMECYSYRQQVGSTRYSFTYKEALTQTHTHTHKRSLPGLRAIWKIYVSCWMCCVFERRCCFFRIISMTNGHCVWLTTHSLSHKHTAQELDLHFFLWCSRSQPI